MRDYSCLSTDDLSNWRDEGIAFSMDDVKWADSAWAQQVGVCITALPRASIYLRLSFSRSPLFSIHRHTQEHRCTRHHRLVLGRPLHTRRPTYRSTLPRGRTPCTNRGRFNAVAHVFELFERQIG